MTTSKELVKSTGNYLRNPTALRKIRAEKGLSQASMAKTLEMSVSGYGGKERGDTPLSKEEAETVAGKLGKSMKSLFKAHKKDKTKFVAV